MKMSSFERKFGKYAIKNLSLVLVLCYALGYVLSRFGGGGTLLLYMTLDPYAILHGQIWRLFTWIMIPMESGNFFLTLIMLYFYYWVGTTLERAWGTYRYNVYMFQGMLFTIVGSFLMMGYHYIFYPDGIASVGPEIFFLTSSLSFNTYYINMSIFLAFAATFPEVEVLLMLFLPVKVKWLGIIDGVMLVFMFLQVGVVGKFAIVASLLNFMVFFVTSRHMAHLNPKQIHRRQEFKRDVKRSTGGTRHKCAVCGRTEVDHPELQFRFCSKCDGNYEYCEEHLYTHTHVHRS